jgi:N-acetyllactosaminide beta-1,3-N-acetylglucosaminyltransferase
MIPSKDLNAHFSQFSNRKQSSVTKEDKNTEERLVYVVPAFESKSSRKVYDKQSLISEWDLQNVRPFYQNVCWKCQKVTDYDRWRGLPSLPFFDVGYVLQWEDPWEPFYIARKQNLPLYDGRFKQYGFNRISQVFFYQLIS